MALLFIFFCFFLVVQSLVFIFAHEKWNVKNALLVTIQSGCFHLNYEV